MALVSLVHEGRGWHSACELLDLLHLPLECVAVVGILWEAHGAHHEALLVRHCEARLHAEFIGLVCLSLGDALDLGRMQAVDLALRRALLREDQVRQDQRALVLLEACVVDLPLDVTHRPNRHGLQALQNLLGPLELLGLRMATVLAEAPIHEFSVALPELDAFGPSNAQHGRVHLPIQAGIDRMLNGLGLYRCVHDDLLKVLLCDRARGLPRLDRGLEQLLHAFLTDALPPARHLRG